MQTSHLMEYSVSSSKFIQPAETAIPRPPSFAIFLAILAVAAAWGPLAKRFDLTCARRLDYSHAWLEQFWKNFAKFPG